MSNPERINPELEYRRAVKELAETFADFDRFFDNSCGANVDRAQFVYYRDQTIKNSERLSHATIEVVV